MTKKERIAALEKQVAELTEKMTFQGKLIEAMALRYPATQTFGPFTVSPNTRVDQSGPQWFFGDPMSSVATMSRKTQ